MITIGTNGNAYILIVSRLLIFGLRGDRVRNQSFYNVVRLETRLERFDRVFRSVMGQDKKEQGQR